VNGWLTWALGSLDRTVPNARQLAWSEYTRNTLANHATQFPNHWDGTISVDDACEAFYSSDPSFCGVSLTTSYAGQITEQPTWMVMDAVRLAGVTPTEQGYTIDPHYPFDHFSLRLPQVGVASEANRMRGYVTPQRDGALQMDVKLPAGALLGERSGRHRKQRNGRAEREVAKDANVHAWGPSRHMRTRSGSARIASRFDHEKQRSAAAFQGSQTCRICSRAERLTGTGSPTSSENTCSVFFVVPGA